ncbi:MAG: ribonuclease H-like domain-containing protein [Synergistaceae bacterium]|nr:ribonuclease H-like domain-containing protein [Synergistaceae bacterium]
MARPNRYDPEKFGRLDGYLPKNVTGRITPNDDAGLPKEIDVRGLPDGEWISRGVYRMERVIPYGRTYGDSEFENPEKYSKTLEPWGCANSCVYLDLETTGLSRGTGTYAFLVGLGFCGRENFRVVQLFLASPGWERSWLSALEAELPKDFGLVTYNGRSFDLPLLRTRYTLARAVPSWDENPHLDLLLLARHFYRGRMPSCSLGELEPRVLGVHRTADDIPGMYIPEMYTEFLRTTDATPLRGIFYHNTLDIVSLAALQTRISKLADMKGHGGEDMIRCGDLWNMTGDVERAEAAWRRALDFSTHANIANARLGEKAKSDGDYEAARDYFERAAEGDKHPLRNLESLAKIEEHRIGDCEAALAHAEAALKWLEARRPLRDYRWDLERQNLLHRIRRLKRKLGREDEN